MRETWPAAERNKDALKDALGDLLPERGLILEISSGTGQHVHHFSTHYPHLEWQPSEFDRDRHDSIRAWTNDLENVRAPVFLDVTQDNWPIDRCDAIFNANMIHIAPWDCALGLLDGAARTTSRLLLYGPFIVSGIETAPSNLAFSESLKARNPAWGVRHLDDVMREANARGFAHKETRAMPANNFLVHLERG